MASTSSRTPRRARRRPRAICFGVAVAAIWRAVRAGDWKYVSRQNGEAVEEWLFDLARDPEEKNNLLAERTAEVARLKTKLAAWEKEVRPVR